MTLARVEVERFRRMGDSDADSVARDVWKEDKERPRGSVPLLKAIGKWEPGGDMSGLPASVRDYIMRSEVPLPAWADLRRLSLAQAAYRQRKLFARVLLATYSLPVTYLHAETSLTLARSGQLVMHVRRRLRDTLAFAETMMEPGSFGPEGRGWQWARKIRLTHALVRTSESPPSSRAPVHVKDEMPLDQAELAFVLQSFGWVVLDGLSRIGRPLSADEGANHIHAWSIIGHLLGVVDDLLPGIGPKAPDARDLFEQIQSELIASGDSFVRDEGDELIAGRLLAAALNATLVQLFREQAPDNYKSLLARWRWLDEALQQLPRVEMRKYCGVRAARHLRIGRAPLTHWAICKIAMMLVDIEQVADYGFESESRSYILSGTLLE